jgi:FtsH-binding integral membrane protein
MGASNQMPTDDRLDRYGNTLPRYRDADLLAAFMRGVYGWMCGGLLMTAVTAWLVSSSPALTAAIFGNRAVFWILALAQLGLVFTLSTRVNRMTSGTASALFVAYSALTGVTLSAVLLAFTGESVFTTFVVTAGMFGALAMYGTVTRRQLSGLGQFLFMGLIGLVLASIVGLFWHNDALQFVISFVGVILFAGLTVYDANRLRELAFATSAGPTSGATIVGALALYLDFINLFLFLLRFLGNRRDDW